MPILIDVGDQIVAGHGRLAAAQLLGIQEVPTICVDHLSPNQVRALQIADNKLTELSSWNEPLLSKTLLELSQADLEFSLEATGFDMGEIDYRIAGISGGRGGGRPSRPSAKARKQGGLQDRRHMEAGDHTA